MNIYNYLIIVSKKNIPLHRDFKKTNREFKLILSHPPTAHLGALLPAISFVPVDNMIITEKKTNTNK